MMAGMTAVAMVAMKAELKVVEKVAQMAEWMEQTLADWKAAQMADW